MRIADLALKKNGNRYSQIEIQPPSFQWPIWAVNQKVKIRNNLFKFHLLED